MIDLVWCDGCSRLWTRSSLKTETGILCCPACGRELPTHRMTIFECPRCYRKILYMPEYQGKIICECEQTEEEPSAASDVISLSKESVLSDEAERISDPDEPAAENIHWQSSDDEEIAYAPPRGKNIRYKDTLTLEDHQAACFSCGGKLLWARGPAFLPVGYDSRDPDEILLAYQCGEETGLPPMINTSIIIFDLRKRSGLSGALLSPVSLAGKIGFLPAFRFDLVVQAPERLRSVSFENEVPRLSELKEHVIRQMTLDLAKRVECYISDADTGTGAEETVREHLEMCLSTTVQEDRPGSDWGLRADEVQLTGCTFFHHFCPVCHLPVPNEAAECDNGHPVRWCPACGEVQDQGICINGHQFRFCRLCGREVLTAGGKCPRHGSLGMTI